LHFYDRGRIRAWPDAFLGEVAARLRAVEEVTAEVAFARLAVGAEVDRRQAGDDLDIGSAA